MKYFIDTEFHEYKKQPKLFGIPIGKPVDTIELISIGIIDENNNHLYLRSKDFDLKTAYKNDWLRENVLNQYCSVGKLTSLSDLEGVAKNQLSILDIKKAILNFLQFDKAPEFYGYFSDYDWVVFCWIFGRMIDLPKNFPMYCIDVNQILNETIQNKDNQKEIKKHVKYNLRFNQEHHPLSDAAFAKDLHDLLLSIKNG